METLALYLLKSVAWLTGFALVYILFLKNERFFELNRVFLISGILAAFVLPFVTISYKAILPVPGSSQSEAEIINGVLTTQDSAGKPDFGLLLFYLYLSGLLFVAFIIIKQTGALLKVIRRAGTISSDQVKLIKTAEYDSAFSFFSYVFVNPSVTEIEIKEIMNHEMVHIRQKHWLDLMLVEFLCIMQWFNPVIWIYIRLVRQNHEYIADRVALQRTSDPAIYRATLLNQIVGSPVVILANSFNYSLNKKRFNMMKNIISSPYRKMKILFILPVFAILFYAFAKPDYQYISQADNPGTQELRSQASDRKVKGTIVGLDGTPLHGASVIVMGTTVGSTSDSKGFFKIENVPEDAAIVVSYVGYKSKVIKSEFVSGATIKMERDTISYLNSSVGMPPPPPPPPPSPPFKIKNSNGGPPPLVVLDGVITDIDVNVIDPTTLQNISVLKDKPATDKYGDKGKNGVIEITSKSKNPMSESKVAEVESQYKSGEDLFVIVEELPEFPGGTTAMQAWISKNKKYLGGAFSDKIDGQVYVTFIVTSKGKIGTPIIKKSLHPILDLEALRLVSSMPDWKPGLQHGKPVDVQVMVPIDFKLP